MKELQGKTAVITGAASGIGLALAKACAARGMRVVMSDIEQDALDTQVEALQAQGATVLGVRCDVANAAEVDSLAHTARETFGAVHLLCNNAGVFTATRPSWNATLDDWTWIVGVNLMGVIHGVRSFLPAMIAQGEEAHIVNTASLAGITLTGGALYRTTKTAVVAYSESLYLELLGAGLRPRISVLCPGIVDTQIVNSERNRPAHLGDTDRGALPTDAQLALARAAFKQGLSPDYVAREVLMAVEEERFYVLTDPDWNSHVTARAARLVGGENPAVLPPPGL